MRDTCCRHCVDGCEGVSGVWMHAAQEQPVGETAPVAYSVWKDGGCPMCAEAERIASAIKSIRDGEWAPDSRPTYCEGYDDALEVALSYIARDAS